MDLPKKRGRKPKNVVEPKIPKKRGRKPKNNINNLNVFNKILDTNFDKNTSNNIILHLKIKSNDILGSNNPCAYNTFSFDEEKIDYSKKEQSFFKNIKQTQETKTFLNKYNNNNISRNIYDVVLSLNKTTNNKIWPISTNNYCKWCVHPFETVPCGIPSHYNNGKFTCYGCFCSFNCAASYIFDKKKHNMWEEYSLLNLLYYKIYNKKIKIKLAPDRDVLNIFGGVLDIEQFRNNALDINTKYIVHNPPIIPIIPKIEEIRKINSDEYIPINQSLMVKAEKYKDNKQHCSIVADIMNLTVVK